MCGHERVPGRCDPTQAPRRRVPRGRDRRPRRDRRGLRRGYDRRRLRARRPRLGSPGVLPDGPEGGPRRGHGGGGGLRPARPSRADRRSARPRRHAHGGPRGTSRLGGRGGRVVPGGVLRDGADDPAGGRADRAHRRLVPLRGGHRPRRPQLAGVSAPDRTARPGGRTHPRGSRVAQGGRGTPAHSKGVARLPHPQHLDRQAPGGRCRPPRPQARRGGAARAARHPGGGRRGDARTAGHPGDPAYHRGAHGHPRAARRAGLRGRPCRRTRGDRRGAPPDGDGRPRGVPHRPGGPHQRRQARGPGEGQRPTRGFAVRAELPLGETG